MSEAYLEIKKNKYVDRYPNKDIPDNFMKKWTEEDESNLLEHLKNGLTKEEIANLFKRSNGSITSRCRKIAKQLYIDGYTENEIIEKTKITNEELEKIVTFVDKQNQNNNKHKTTKKSIIKQSDNYEDIQFLKGEVSLLRKEMNNIKKCVFDIKDMLEAIYEFDQ